MEYEKSGKNDAVSITVDSSSVGFTFQGKFPVSTRAALEKQLESLFKDGVDRFKITNHQWFYACLSRPNLSIKPIMPKEGKTKMKTSTKVKVSGSRDCMCACGSSIVQNIRLADENKQIFRYSYDINRTLFKKGEIEEKVVELFTPDVDHPVGSIAYKDRLDRAVLTDYVTNTVFHLTDSSNADGVEEYPFVLNFYLATRPDHPFAVARATKGFTQRGGYHTWNRFELEFDPLQEGEIMSPVTKSLILSVCSLWVFTYYDALLWNGRRMGIALVVVIITIVAAIIGGIVGVLIG